MLTVDDLTLFVDGAVMVPDVSKVDTNLHPGLKRLRGLFEMSTADASSCA
jgi:hypothetical protein